MIKGQKSKIFDGSEIVANCRITYNLDFYNGQHNCNPTNGKHKTLSKLKDGRFAIIWSDENGSNIGRVVSDEYALEEIITAKKTRLLYNKRFIKLKELYETNKDKYDNIIPRYKRVNSLKIEEIVIVTKDGFLVGLYSNNMKLRVKKITDLQEPPSNYYRIWGIEDGIQAHRQLSELSNKNE